MSDREAFMRTIIENPDDDVPRLVFADWLEENGDADRAAFIRLQCEAARLPEGNERRDECERTASQIYRRNHKQWRKELPELPGNQWGMFERGFVSEAGPMTSAALTRNAKQLFEATPLRSLRLEAGVGLKFPGLHQIPEFARLQRLSLEQENSAVRDTTQTTVPSLLLAPTVRRVRSLALDGVSLSDRDGLVLSQTGNCDWEELSVRCEFATIAPIAGLLLSGNLSALRTLKMRHHWGRIDLGLWHDLDGEPRLRTLELQRYDLANTGGRLLANASCLSRLESLAIRSGVIGNQSILDLTESESFPQLHTLILEPSSTVSERCLRSPKSGDMTERLQRLTLSADLGDDGLVQLVFAGRWRNLRHLSISNRGNPLSDQSLTRLFTSELMPRLKSLRIAGAWCSRQAANRLIEQELPNLRELSIQEFSPEAKERIKRHFGTRIKRM